RSKRGRAMQASALDGIAGLGPARRRALLDRFVTVSAIREASEEELQEVQGIGPALAAQITAALRSEQATESATPDGLDVTVDMATGEILEDQCTLRPPSSNRKEHLVNTEQTGPSRSETAGDVVIITGLAGAGRETAAHALEDMGWYVVYNIAPQLIGTLYDLQASAEGRDNCCAVVVDPRSGPFFAELSDGVMQLRKQDLRLRLLFLTADEATLVRRFDAVRRPHPLQGEEGVLEGIRREREMLAPYRRSEE